MRIREAVLRLASGFFRNRADEKKKIGETQNRQACAEPDDPGGEFAESIPDGFVGRIKAGAKLHGSLVHFLGVRGSDFWPKLGIESIR